jgi:hypothetical protein
LLVKDRQCQYLREVQSLVWMVFQDQYSIPPYLLSFVVLHGYSPDRFWLPQSVGRALEIPKTQGTPEITIVLVNFALSASSWHGLRRLRYAERFSHDSSCS